MSALQGDLQWCIADSLLRAPPLLLFFPFALRLFPCSLLRSFLLCGDARHDIVERVVDDAHSPDFGRATKKVNDRYHATAKRYAL